MVTRGIKGIKTGAIAVRTAVASVFGGLASKATGGSFHDGAVNAAMVHLFNAEAQKQFEHLKAENRRGVVNLLKTALEKMPLADVASLDVNISIGFDWLKTGFYINYEINLDRNGRIYDGIGGGIALGASAPVTLTLSDVKGVSFIDSDYSSKINDFLAGGEVNASMTHFVAHIGSTWAFTSTTANLSFDPGLGFGHEVSVGGNWSWLRN